MNNNNISFLSVEFDPFNNQTVTTIQTTEAQREIWTNVQIGGHAANCAYNESVSLHLDGQFNPDAFTQAVQTLFARHDALRSTFSDDGLTMLIASIVNIDVPLIDLSGKSTAAIEKEVNNILESEAEYNFNLSSGPLGMVKVIRFSDKKHQLILTFHHIVCDGWSLGIMMQDLGKMYSAYVSEKPYVDEPAVSYIEYSKNEIAYLNSEEYKKVEAFWLDRYRGDIPSMELPLNKTRPSFRTYNAKRIDLEVDPVLVEAIKKAGGKNGASFITTLTAAFEVYLHRITGSSDVVVGLAAAGQSAIGKDNLVGHCVNLLPLRSRVDASLNFYEYLKHRKSQILDAYDHQRYTFGSLIRNLNLPRDPSRIPLVPVSFNVDMGITNGVNFEGCTYKFTTNKRNYENFEFFINAAGNGNELTLECTFNTDLFTEEMVLLRMHEFVELLTSIINEPAKPLGFLNILTAKQKNQLYNEWQGKYNDFSANGSIIEMINKEALSHPRSVALIYENQPVTYFELIEQSNKLANYLISKGIGSNSLVAVFMERSVGLMVSILGILKAGAAYVPIDLTYPEDRINYVLEDSNAVVVITSLKARNKISFPGKQVLIAEELFELSKSFPSTASETKIKPDQLAYVIYTSGSTGKPKGVAIEHYTVVNYISWCNKHYFGDRSFGNFGLYSSLSFDLTVTSIFCTLSRGKTLTIFHHDSEVMDVLKDSFGKNTIVDSIKMTPAHVQLLEGLGLKTNKILKAIVGGEELTTRHVEILHDINPDMEIVNEYGPTEATVGCVIKDVKVPADALTIGKPIDNAEVFILDQNLQPLPPGIPGKIFIAGGGLARGYINRPELTDEKFLILTINGDPMRLYDSGDIGRYRLNGDMEFLGRADNQVKIRGYRIELGEIESELSKMQEVKELTIIAREDIPGDKRIIAYIVLNKNAEPNALHFREQLVKVLPEYMVPAAFVFIEKLPLTANGKIDRKLLPSPSEVINTDQPVFEEPKTPIEQVIANIWCSVLSLAKVGRNDNFFELGGHSLLGVKMLNEVENQLGVKINLSSLFAASTIAEIARIVNREGPSKPISCLVPIQIKGTKRPLFCIHMHNGNVNRWRVMIKHLGDDQPVYAIQPLGLDINKEPHRTIEEMASHYVQVIQEVQPHGPYNLIGLCFSGMVVFEMAAQLQLKGEKVAFLSMVNNYAPPENPTMYRIKSGLNKFMKMDMGEKFSYTVVKNINIGKKLFYKAGILTPQAENLVEEVQIDESAAEYGHDLRTIHSVALLNYHPTHVFHGNLFIFRTADPIESYYNEFLGWDRLVDGKIETTVIEGCDNDTIITEEPYNALLSRKVKKYLDELA